MLTHHQYTYIQKEQNIAVSSADNENRPSMSHKRTSNKYSEEGSRHLRRTIGNKSSIISNHQLVYHNHTPQNIVLRVSVNVIAAGAKEVIQTAEEIYKREGMLRMVKGSGVCSEENFIAFDNNDESKEPLPKEFKKDDNQSCLDSLKEEFEKRRNYHKEKFNLQRHIKELEASPRINEMIEFLMQTNWRNITNRQFLEFISGEIYSVTAFQKFISVSEIPPSLEKLAYDNREFLIKDKYGCHVMRIFIRKLPGLLDVIGEMVLERFAEMCCNEFSNKVMQVVVACKDHLKPRFLKLFCKNWSFIKRSISCIYLLTACLRNTPNSSEHFKLVGEYLYNERSPFLVIDKHDKRILARYMEYCDEEEMDRFYRILLFKFELHERCSDKYMVYIFRLLLRRGHKQSMILLLSSLESQPGYYLKIQAFRSLILDIIKEKDCMEDFKKEVIRTLNLATEQNLTRKEAVSFIESIGKEKRISGLSQVPNFSQF